MVADMLNKYIHIVKKITRGKKLEGLKNIKSLLFDFFLEYFNIIIEVDGGLHFREFNKGHFKNKELKKTQERDFMKMKFALSDYFNFKNDGNELNFDIYIYEVYHDLFKKINIPYDMMLSVADDEAKTKEYVDKINLKIKELVNEIPGLKAILGDTDALVLEQVEIQVKYEVYIEKEKELIQKMSQLEDNIIPDSFNYEKLTAISTEARQKLTKIKPRTIGQAGRISGVNPSDIQILLVYMGR
jgi:tRNA U34 5-carboxymethylaminomethyl modifying enzyme MnmG/GidA